MKATKESADDAINTIEELTLLHERNKTLVEKSEKAMKNVMKVFLYLEMHPIVDINKTSEDLGITFNTTSRAISKLVKLGILEQTVRSQRYRVFAYQDYLKILRRDT